jgi:hypothetical protein
MIKHKKTGVIFIDCWQQNWQWQNSTPPKFDFYLNMIEELKRYDIDYYAFHTSFLSLGYITQDVLHYFRKFVELKFEEQDRRQGIQDLLDATGTERLSQHLLPLAQSDKSIFIPSYNGFVQFCEDTNVGQWIVVGAHWPICTHEKALGFNNLLKYKQQRPHLHFYSIPSCTARWVHTEAEQVATVLTDADYQNDTLNWRSVGENLYELII